MKCSSCLASVVFCNLAGRQSGIQALGASNHPFNVLHHWIGAQFVRPLGDHPLVQPADGIAARGCEGKGEYAVEQTGYSAADHREAKAASGVEMLTIGFAHMGGVVGEGVGHDLAAFRYDPAKLCQYHAKIIIILLHISDNGRSIFSWL
jgi:hypothetical protein